LIFEDAHANGPFFANVKVVNSLMNYEVGAPSREKSGVLSIRDILNIIHLDLKNMAKKLAQ